MKQNILDLHYNTNLTRSGHNNLPVNDFLSVSLDFLNLILSKGRRDYDIWE